jgi:hypothetical protein
MIVIFKLIKIIFFLIYFGFNNIYSKGKANIAKYYINMNILKKFKLYYNIII